MGWKYAKAAGESPLFPPECDSEEQACQKLKCVVAQSPFERGYEHSRWTLSLLCKECDWLEVETEAGMCQLLDRLGFSWTKGRHFTRSPDPLFDEKKAYLEQVQHQADKCDDVVLLYLDEMIYYSQPTLSRDWSPRAKQPTATRRAVSKYSESCHVLGAVNQDNGRLHFDNTTKMSRWKLLSLYQDIRKAYTSASKIIVVQDNLALHFHQDVLGKLERQTWPFDFYHPPNWADPNPAADHDGELPIQVVALPTYSSWLNPIERLWRWLKNKVLHMHPFADAWDKLKRKVNSTLSQFTQPSPQMLEHLGLSGG
ncbi:MAG: IS630 family transposase [Anaerolineae bacterium]|nr:IS630 family transposase [Anaerolineae bacterium]